MEEIRPLLHEIQNALAIARGLTEAVQASMKGDIDMGIDQQVDKLARVVRALERIETAAQKVRSLVNTNN